MLAIQQLIPFATNLAPFVVRLTTIVRHWLVPYRKSVGWDGGDKGALPSHPTPPPL